MKQTNRTTIYTLLIILLFGLALPTQGQNNPFKINDSLYPLYLRANYNRKNHICLEQADSLRRKAIRLKDHKAEILALLVPLKYQITKQHNFPAVWKASQQVRKKAQEYNYLQYYFYTSTTMANYLLSEDRFDEAKELMQKDIQFATKHKHPYGIQAGYVALGNMLMARGEYAHAIFYYETALQFSQEHMQKQERSTIYPHICDGNIRLGRFQEVVNAANEGIRYCYSEPTKAGLYGYKAIGHFMTGDYANFKKSYQEYFKRLNTVPIIATEYLILLNSLYAISNQDSVKYQEYKNKLSGLLRKYSSYAYYSYNGQYDKAAKVMNKIVRLTQNGGNTNILTDLAGMRNSFAMQIADIDKQKAANEMAKLQLQLAQLQLASNNLEISNADRLKKLAEMQNGRNLLALQNQKLKSNKLGVSIDSQKKLVELQKRQYNMQKLIMVAMAAIALLLIVGTIIYLKANKKMERRLSKLSKNLTHTLAELNIANKEAQHADQQKTLFIQNMSHEIRTPLNAIVGFSQVLTDPSFNISDEEKSDLTYRITENSEQLSNLINNILDLTSIESGKYQLIIEPADINGVCRDAVEEARSHVAEGVMLTFNTQLAESEKIETDGMRVKQVVTHLLNNAIKNTTAGSIQVNCSKNQKGQTFITVTDTGVGIPQDKQETIFERFGKLDQFKPGSGLGLEICRTIAHKLGGDVYLDPDYTNGARFCFFFGKPEGKAAEV